MLLNERPDEVEYRTQNVSRGFQQRSLPYAFPVGTEFLVEAVDIDNQAKTPEGAVTEFVRRYPKVPIIDVN